MPVSAVYVTGSPAIVTVFVMRTGWREASGILARLKMLVSGALVAALSAAPPRAASAITRNAVLKNVFI
jgi:hypothetical protein